MEVWKSKGLMQFAAKLGFSENHGPVSGALEQGPAVQDPWQLFRL